MCMRERERVCKRDREQVGMYVCLQKREREREREREPRLNKQAFDNISRSVLLQVFMSEGYECVVH